MEKWKDIPGFEGLYQISNMGRAKSMERITRNGFGSITKKEKILKKAISKKGYEFISFTVNLKQKGFFVHRLIAQAFIPNPCNLPEVNHINGVKIDNRIENLEWVTTKQNSAHCHLFLNPSVKRGVESRSAKLDIEKIQEIKKLYSTGEYTYKQLGVMFSVSDRTIGGVITGKYWNKDPKINIEKHSRHYKLK